MSTDLPLPEPYDGMLAEPDLVIDGYTAEQMREYAAAAVAAERERCADYRNWMRLAFRALNDADGVLETLEPEHCSEYELLNELRERVKSLAYQVPVLLHNQP